MFCVLEINVSTATEDTNETNYTKIRRKVINIISGMDVQLKLRCVLFNCCCFFSTCGDLCCNSYDSCESLDFGIYDL